jgi:putative heme-binding domain-containing protein
MFKPIYTLFYAIALLLFNGIELPDFKKAPAQQTFTKADSLLKATNWPAELKMTSFVGPDVTPSPSCLAVAANGDVFVGVDMIGSLGKTPGKGSIVKLVDTNNDGKPDLKTTFAKLDNPRGIIANGDKVFVLHTVFSKETGIATGMDLVVYEDKNHDGIADGPAKPLIQHVSSPKFLQSRDTDHSTNGIRMGIDGWIYIAVGDFGFHGAVDRSGKTLTQLGGGILRVRPDGTEMEVYTHGLRNIYDVAIDPFMNIFARGNTNDGGGWNIRFSHQIQSGEYGYPVLFKNFTDEILPALVDVGGGSGTGALFMTDPTWPAKYNNVPMMADWGRSQLYIHRVEPNGPSFTQKEEEFIKLPQITDVDVDASGRMYMSAWDGAGYSGNANKGFVVRVVPNTWSYKAFPNLTKLSVKQLAAVLKSESGTARLAAQQELLSRPAKQATDAAWQIATDKNLDLAVRVAGIYTYAQAAGASGNDNLVKLISDNTVKEFALRALADRKTALSTAPTAPFIQALQDPSERVRTAATIGLGRLDRKEAISALLATPVPSSFTPPKKGTEGPHATPNAAIVLPHLAVRALLNLNAVDECVKAIGGPNSTIALWALRYMHTPEAVDGMLKAYQSATKPALKTEILTTLARLYQVEAPYDGSWWWSTRPDTRGPYYKGIVWEKSPEIKSFLVAELGKSSDKQFYTDLNGRLRLGIEELGTEEPVVAAKEEVKIDLEKIKNKKGQVGEASIEDVMLAMDKIPGDAALGKTLFVNQGCIACHSIEKGEVMKGPYMGQIGSIMNREQIAESILKPNASISQGFSTVLITAKKDKSYVGFITEETSNGIVLRDITGQVTRLRSSDIFKREEMENSMMPAGLANSLSYEEFASLITFLSKQKK